MGFHERLVAETKRDQEELFGAPFIRHALEGRVSLDGYLAFLEQAYHHVRHTVPLMMAVGASLSERHRWLIGPLAEYIEEEVGHEEWILADIAACGGDVDTVRSSEPGFACETMIAFAYDVARRRNPLGYFGMVHVLEGASVRGASAGAAVVVEKLGIPAEGTTYLTSHGALDQEHVAFFEKLMDRIEDASDQDFVLHCAHRFFRLYGEIFRGLPLPDAREETR